MSGILIIFPKDSEKMTPIRFETRKKVARNRLNSGLGFSFRGARVDIEIRCYGSHNIIEGNGRGIR